MSSFFWFIFFSILSMSLRIEISFMLVATFSSPYLTYSVKKSFILLSISICASWSS